MMPEDIREVEKFAESVMLAAQNLRKAAVAVEAAEAWITREPLSDRAKKQHLDVSATYVTTKLALDNILNTSADKIKAGVAGWILNVRANWKVLPRTKAINALECIINS